MKLAADIPGTFGTIGRPAELGNVPDGGARGISFILDNVIGIFFAAGTIAFVLMFIWGAVQMILSGGDKEAVAKARAKITWAIIGVTLMALSYVIFALLEYMTGFRFFAKFQGP